MAEMRACYRGMAVLACAAVMGVLSTACGNSDSVEVPSPSAGGQAATQSATATISTEHARILEAYRDFVAAANRAANDADPELPALVEVADGQALIDTQLDIRRNAEDGRRYAGQVVVVSAEVTELDPEVPPPMPGAAVVSCWDVSGYRLVDESQSPVPGQAIRERFTVSAQLRHLEGDDRWIVVVVESDLETPC